MKFNNQSITKSRISIPNFSVDLYYEEPKKSQYDESYTPETWSAYPRIESEATINGVTYRSCNGKFIYSIPFSTDFPTYQWRSDHIQLCRNDWNMTIPEKAMDAFRQAIKQWLEINITDKERKVAVSERLERKVKDKQDDIDKLEEALKEENALLQQYQAQMYKDQLEQLQ